MLLSYQHDIETNVNTQLRFGRKREGIIHTHVGYQTSPSQHTMPLVPINACSPTCHRPNPTQTSSLLPMPPTSIDFPQNLIHTIFPPIHLSTNNAFNIFHSLHALDDLKSLLFFTSIDLRLLMGASWGTQECGFIRLVGGM